VASLDWGAPFKAQIHVILEPTAFCAGSQLSVRTYTSLEAPFDMPFHPVVTS